MYIYIYIMCVCVCVRVYAIQAYYRTVGSLTYIPNMAKTVFRVHIIECHCQERENKEILLE